MFKLIVFSDPTPDLEAEYNEWYNTVHLRDVLAVPGFVSAQRFKLRTLRAGEFRNRYLAIYEMDTDDPDAVMAIADQRLDTVEMIVSEAIDVPGTNVGIFEPCSNVVYAAPGRD